MQAVCKFCNRTILGGYIAFYADADGKEEYHNHICCVSKRTCEAKEDKFGGIVVELIQIENKSDDNSNSSEENE
ncbi:MAG: hypothetical protein COZ18_10375 [Flexibacter sp. CG_4_10_14_3_um_filter_32_15]|nr:MAG: hypothetical protein COZ18_10375 [Flexibacter sp. CG_4_10_14_3_um_filter_32_15]